MIILVICFVLFFGQYSFCRSGRHIGVPRVTYIKRAGPPMTIPGRCHVHTDSGRRSTSVRSLLFCSKWTQSAGASRRADWTPARPFQRQEVGVVCEGQQLCDAEQSVTLARGRPCLVQPVGPHRALHKSPLDGAEGALWRALTSARARLVRDSSQWATFGRLQISRYKTSGGRALDHMETAQPTTSRPRIRQKSGKKSMHREDGARKAGHHILAIHLHPWPLLRTLNQTKTSALPSRAGKLPRLLRRLYRPPQTTVAASEGLARRCVFFLLLMAAFSAAAVAVLASLVSFLSIASMKASELSNRAFRRFQMDTK